MTNHRRVLSKLLIVLAVLALVAAACSSDGEETTTTAAEATGEPTGEPIIIGGSLALTGGLAPTAAIHKVAGDLFVERLNANGGLLGRPVEWVVLDDEGVPDNAAAIYERLITEDQVDLIIGPYGTGTITAAMAVAEREGYVFPHHTASLTYAYTYPCHFPTWPTGVDTNLTNPRLVFDALEESGNPPETIVFVTNEFPGTQYIAYGPPDSDEGGAVKVAEEEYGYEVLEEINFPLGNSDWGPIAAQVAELDPDFIYMGAIGVDGPNLLTALDAIGYVPRGHFYQWPAPGPLVAAPNSEGAFSVTTFEPHPPFTDDPYGKEVSDAFAEAATEAGIYPVFEAQGSASWTAWEVLTQGVEGAGSLDQQEICDWLVNNEVETVLGTIDFDPDQQNYYGDLTKVKQIQNGEFVVISPPDWAAPGATPQL